MIFQDPMTALNPVYTVGDQLVETIMLHQDVSRSAAREIAIEALNDVQIPNAESKLDDFPHQFSGGMRQRVMIAMGLSCNPVLLIADEPTTALDVTTQAQIMDLMLKLAADRGTAVLLITHDLGVVAGFCDTICWPCWAAMPASTVLPCWIFQTRSSHAMQSTAAIIDRTSAVSASWLRYSGSFRRWPMPGRMI